MTIAGALKARRLELGLANLVEGRGKMGDGERVEEDRGLLGIQVIPRAGSVGSAGADRNGHIPSKK